MKNHYSELFKDLLQTYYEGVLEIRVKKLLEDSTIDKDALCR